MRMYERVAGMEQIIMVREPQTKRPHEQPRSKKGGQ
jgi:hypothetical protein